MTTLGLTVALLGIIVLYSAAEAGGTGLSSLGWSALQREAALMPRATVALALVLILGGLAAKIGWAPVHHWLPDAHSEAPAPVSAMLSSALLPNVMLVAWRLQQSVGEPAAAATSHHLFIGFGLASLAVAVPFLWRRIPIKRFLAYSSLEHVGVMALGIGFANPLAVAGVVLHVWGHALAKALGFYASMPIFGLQPTAARRQAVGIGRTNPEVGAAVGISLAALAGVPPSPLFFSELFILAGGIEAGQYLVAAAAAILLALGFIGLAHQLIESLLGRPRRIRSSARLHRIRALNIFTSAGLVSLSAIAGFLPGSALVNAMWRGQP